MNVSAATPTPASTPAVRVHHKVKPTTHTAKPTTHTAKPTAPAQEAAPVITGGKVDTHG
jgi:hypothetical protein